MTMHEHDSEDAGENSGEVVAIDGHQLLPQLVAHLREHRARLRAAART